MSKLYLLLIFTMFIGSAIADPLPATTCTDFQTLSEGSCVHKCDSIYHTWNGTLCIPCPSPTQFRNGAQVNTCQERATCPEGSRKVDDVFGLDIDNISEVRYVCEYANNVVVRVDMLGQMYNIFDEAITAAPTVCEGSENGLLQKDSSGTCRNRCQGMVNSSYAQFTFFNSENECVSCPSNKVVQPGSNNCVCPNETTWIEARGRCENAATAEIFSRTATNCNPTTRNESECRNACLQLRQIYQRNPSIQYEMIQCGMYIPELGSQRTIPRGFEWDGTPTIIRSSLGYGHCGVKHDICFGTAKGTTPSSTPGGATEITTLMIKCYVPQNSITCPTNLTEDSNCTPAPNDGDRQDLPGIQNCTADSRATCLCNGRPVNNGSRCSNDTRIANTRRKCFGSGRNSQDCVRACIEINYGHDLCPTRDDGLRILSGETL